MIFLVDDGERFGLSVVRAVSESGESLDGQMDVTVKDAVAKLKSRLTADKFVTVKADDKRLTDAYAARDMPAEAENERLADEYTARCQEAYRNAYDAYIDAGMDPADAKAQALGARPD